MATSPTVSSLFDTAFRAGGQRDRALTVSDWADEFRMLSGVSSAEPGRWRTERTPYLREPMDCLSPLNPTRRVVMMTGAQIGKTECGNNWLGYIIDQSPGPMLYVEPTVDVAKRVSKQRIAPMIEATERLRNKVRESRSRDSGNTVQVKEFAGGVLILTGANSGAGLRSMPVRFLFMDEVDDYPGDVEGQGDPILLAEKRTSTFARRKTLLTSTPTIKGLSRIEREFLKSDQRYFFLPCPACGHMDHLTWGKLGHHRIEWEEGKPQSAFMLCGACNERIEERFKTTMLAHGQWRPTTVGDGFTAGFHLSGLYSPLGWKSWGDCATEFVQAKEDPLRLKTWVNTVLAETWEEAGDSVSAGALRERQEKYDGEVPDGVGVLVAAVDVQGDRLECSVVGYGAGEQSWLVAFSQFMGDPAQMKVWLELDKLLLTTFTHKSGRPMKIECTAVDSGGLHTEQTYRFTRARAHRRVFAIKGGSQSGLPLVGRPTNHNRYRATLYVLCVDTGKDIVMSRMNIRTVGPGYMHIPDWIDDEYLAQLAAEKAVRKYVKGRGATREWVKLRERNEALDLTVYALAALYMLGASFIKSLPARAARFAEPLEVNPATPEQPATPAPPAPRPTRARKNWVHNW